VSRRIELLGVRPNHPGRGEPSYIELNVALAYLRGEPVESIVLTPAEAVLLIEQLAIAIRATDAKGQR
jgi:hypothetical protein